MFQLYRHLSQIETTKEVINRLKRVTDFVHQTGKKSPRLDNFLIVEIKGNEKLDKMVPT